jgi:hypothetical protein
MTEKQFWVIIAAGCPRDVEPEEWDETLVEVLVKLDLDELVAFEHQFDDLTDRAYRRDLWGAAYLINGGASDDGFYYFRCWLVGMGKQVYEAALADPDNLVDYVDPELDRYETETYGAPLQAWRQKGGDEAEYERLHARRKRRSPKLKGKDWDFDDDDEVRKRLPRLAALYLDDAGG